VCVHACVGMCVCKKNSVCALTTALHAAPQPHSLEVHGHLSQLLGPDVQLAQVLHELDAL